MKKLDDCSEPLQVLEQMNKIYTQICNLFSHYKDLEQQLVNMETTSHNNNMGNRYSVMMQADDFIAVLIYVVVKSGFPYLMPYIEIISAFTLNKRQQQFEYMRASLEGAVEFILYEMDQHIHRPEDNINDDIVTLTKKRS